MAEDTVKDAPATESVLRRRISDVGLLVLVLVVGSGLALAVLAAPRPVEPRHTPGLVLPADSVESSFARTRDLARSAPDDESARALVDAYRAHGQAELAHADNPGAFAARREATARALAAVRAAHGDDGIAALRARAVVDLEPALARASADRATEEDEALLGGYVESMELYGLVADGRRVAPDAVVRALFHARWNAALGLPLTDGLDESGLRAYWGWLALEAEDAPLDRRLEALDHYDEARGEPDREARGVLSYLSGDGLAASRQFEHAYAAVGTVRLRNHALAALASVE